MTSPFDTLGRLRISGINVKSSSKLRKGRNRKYLAVCKDEDLNYTAVGLSTIGAVGSQGRTFLFKLFSRCVKRLRF